jgi:Na+/proline symporter
MIRVVLKVFLLCITIIILGVFLLALVQMSQSMGQSAIPGLQAGATYGLLIAVAIPCTGYVILNMKSLKIFSKIYNNENRNISDRRPADRNIPTEIAKIYWIFGIIWAALLVLLAILYIFISMQHADMPESYQARQINTLLTAITSVTATLAVWVIIDLLSTRYYLQRFALGISGNG